MNDVSFVVFGHQTLGLEGGGANVSWFSSTPAGIGLRNVNVTWAKLNLCSYPPQQCKNRGRETTTRQNKLIWLIM